jgi:hypothetical protein
MMPSTIQIQYSYFLIGLTTFCLFVIFTLLQFTCQILYYFSHKGHTLKDL